AGRLALMRVAEPRWTTSSMRHRRSRISTTANAPNAFGCCATPWSRHSPHRCASSCSIYWRAARPAKSQRGSTSARSPSARDCCVPGCCSTIACARVARDALGGPAINGLRSRPAPSRRRALHCCFGQRGARRGEPPSVRQSPRMDTGAASATVAPDRLDEMLARYLGPSVLPLLDDPDVTEIYVNPQDRSVRLDTRTRGKIESGLHLEA